MSRFINVFEQALKSDAVDLTTKDVISIIQRLLNKQMIYDDGDSQTERKLFFQAEKVSGLLSEFFEAIGMILYYNSNMKVITISPKGSGHSMSEQLDLYDDLPDYLFKATPRLEMNLILVLRYIYQENAEQGLFDGTSVNVTIETIQGRYHDLTREQMPETLTARRELFQAMKRLRLIRFNDVANADDYVQIDQIITLYKLDDFISITENSLRANIIPIDEEESLVVANKSNVATHTGGGDEA